MKHVDLDAHDLRYKTMVYIVYCRTNNQTVDIFTKTLTTEAKFVKLRVMLGLQGHAITRYQDKFTSNIYVMLMWNKIKNINKNKKS
jgi:hypothetical protein